MKLSDDQISAWIDGTLPPQEAALVADAIATDRNLEDRIETMMNIDRLVRLAVPEEAEIPPELMARLGLKPVAAADTVVPFAPQERVAAATVRTTAGNSMFYGRWKIAAQIALVGFVGLGMALWLAPSTESPEADYHALGAKRASEAAVPNAIVLFADPVSADDARRVARAVGGEIAGEQSAAGAWPLAIAPQDRDEALGKLRQRSDVILAEPVEGH